MCGIYINDLIWSHHNLWCRYIIISFGEEAQKDREIQNFLPKRSSKFGEAGILFLLYIAFSLTITLYGCS